MSPRVRTTPQMKRLPMGNAYCRLCGYRRDVHDWKSGDDHPFESCKPRPPRVVSVGNGVIVWRRERAE